MLNWANQFSICCFLDNQYYQSNYKSFDCLLGTGSISTYQASAKFSTSLSSFLERTNDWILGHFNYEVKNYFEQSRQYLRKPASTFPVYFLFVPETLITLNGNCLTIGVTNGKASSIYDQIFLQSHSVERNPAIEFRPTINKQQYLNCIESLKRHINHGDCYEINYCQEFTATEKINPMGVFRQLTHTSPNPFSSFYRLWDNYLLCASPERYIKKTGEKIISQPIKGTSARNFSDRAKDQFNKEQLAKSAKEQSENVMIVDLVRNDLSKICSEGTVEVEELFGIYSFPQVHQMISTVTGKLQENVGLAEVLDATFPMGSMTGAPKKRVMELIDRYEAGERGIYSGTVGYITPGKDFDFNVVIRSIVYNDLTEKISFHTGSAITALSEPEKEYEECLLKAQAILNVFS